jgi:diguanylate cyclase (GGDEF)-like protein
MPTSALPADANDFDALTCLAAHVCDAPSASIGLLRGNRVWFLAAHGVQLASVDADVAFEPHAIDAPDGTLIVPNAVGDPRFAAHPYVIQPPRIRAYAGAAIVAPDDKPIGCLAVMDYVPRSFGAEQANALRLLARQVSAQLTLRRLQSDWDQEIATRRDLQEKLESYRTRLDDALGRLNTESTLDGLTGLPNRRAFETRLDEETDRARRYELPISLVLLEIDRSTQLQAALGHEKANELLQRLAQHLRRGLRQSDMLSRYSSHGFAILLPNTGFDGCCALAQRMTKSIAAAQWATPHLTVSTGMSSQACAGADSKSILSEAGKALDIAKQGSGSRNLHFTHIS